MDDIYDIKFDIKSGDLRVDIVDGHILLRHVRSGETVCISDAEVQPVVHARWEHLGGDEWRCTKCGEVITTEGSWEKPTKKHCYECGARMDGDEDS